MRFNIKVKYGLFYVFLQIYFSCIIYLCLMIWKLKIDMTGVLAQSLNTSVTHTIKNSVIFPFNCPECNSNALLTKYFSNFKLDRHMWENLCYNVRMEKVNLLILYLYLYESASSYHDIRDGAWPSHETKDIRDPKESLLLQDCTKLSS